MIQKNKQHYLILPIAIIIIFATKVGSLNTEPFFYLLQSNKSILITVIISNIISIAWITNIINTFVFKRSQGSMLRDIKKLESSSFTYILNLLTKVLIPVGLFTYYLSNNYQLVALGHFNYYETLVNKYIYCSIAIAISALIIQAVIIKEKYYNKKARGVFKRKKLKKVPKTNNIIIGTIGEDQSSIDEEKTTQPQYIALSKKTFQTHIAVLGGTGTNKSTALAVPMLIEMTKKFKDVVLIATDLKATLVKELEAVKSKLNRPYKELSLNTDLRINSLYNKDQLKGVNYKEQANILIECSINIINDNGKSGFWNNNAKHLLESCIILTHLKYDYYTYTTLLSVISELEESTVNEYQYLIETTDLSIEEKHNASMGLLGMKEYLAEGGKDMKAGILNTATIFLKLFTNYSVAKIFCPKKEEITHTNLDFVIDTNFLTVISIEEKSIAKPIATYMKLLIAHSVSKLYQKDPDNSPEVIHVKEEYADTATSSDPEHLATMRQKKLYYMAFFQSISQLERRVGGSSASSELVNNFRTKIFLNTTEEETMREMVRIAGEFEQEKKSHSQSQSSQDARRNFIDGGYLSNKSNINESYTSTFEEKRHLKDKDITRLTSAQGYAYINFGAFSKCFKVFFKPYFLDIRTPHQRVLKALGPTENEVIL